MSFDLDGTLARTTLRKLRLLPIVARHPRTFTAYPRAVQRLRARRVGSVRVALAGSICADTGLNSDSVAAVLDQVLDSAWPALFQGASPPPKILAALSWCDAVQIPRAVVSDYPATQKLGHMNLRGWTTVVDCSALGALKPHPDGLFAAAATLGIATHDLIHIGDRWDTDGAAAANAGCRFVHIDQLPNA